MFIRRMRLWFAGLIAFAIGFPFSEKAFGQEGDVVTSSIELGLAIADSADQS